MIDIYSERAHLLALLALAYPAVLFVPGDAEPGHSHGLCLFIDGKQCTWHLADKDLRLFRWLDVEPLIWDGHTTEEKYAWIARSVGADTETAEPAMTTDPAGGKGGE